MKRMVLSAVLLILILTACDNLCAGYEQAVVCDADHVRSCHQVKADDGTACEICFCILKGEG